MDHRFPHRLSLWLGLIILACSSVSAKADGPEAGLQAGVSKVDVTPPIGFAMWGYGARHDAPSVGVGMERPDASEEEFFAGRRQDERFREAFRAFGMDVDALAPEEAAARLTRTSIGPALGRCACRGLRWAQRA